MPKGKRKGKYEHKRTEQPSSSDEDMGIDMTTDNMSETSLQSNFGSNHDDADRRDKHCYIDKWTMHSIINPVLFLGSKRVTALASADMLKRIAHLQSICGLDTNEAERFRNGRLCATEFLKHLPIDKIHNNKINIRKDLSSVATSLFRELSWTEASNLNKEERDSFVSLMSDLSYNKDIEKEYNQLRYTQYIWIAYKGYVHIGDLLRDHATKETEAQEKLDDKVLEIVDALGARSNAARAAALTALRAALQRRSFTHVLCSHRATLADHVSKALRRGRDGEKKAAAAVANLLALQIGEDGIEEFVREVRPALLAAVADGSASVDTKVECCNALAALCYMLEEDLTEILEVMRAFETIFSGSYLKGDGSARVSGAAVSQSATHAAALDGWALLLSLLSTEHTRQLLRTTAPGLQRLVQMLAASSVEVRMAAGGALAIAYERMTLDSDADQEADDEIENALPILEELARDSHKYRAKRERKVQRATFRDILKYFEDDSVPVLKVRVGRESVCCDSWSSRAVYGAVCTVLGGALPVLVTNCAVLRAVLNMQDTAPLPPTRTAATRLQRHLQNAAACKARTLVRNKNRDKRSAALAL